MKKYEKPIMFIKKFEKNVFATSDPFDLDKTWETSVINKNGIDSII